jgi:hypothetical protein
MSIKSTKVVRRCDGQSKRDRRPQNSLSFRRVRSRPRGRPWVQIPDDQPTVRPQSRR